MKKIILTAAGFYNPEIIKLVEEILPSLPNNKVAIITTAAKDKESNAFSQLAQKQLSQIGFDTEFVDLENEGVEKFNNNFSTIYVCGGNTFKLLKFARESNFKKIIEETLKLGGLYIGVSAGSLLIGPSVEIANEVAADGNEVNMTDFTGLNCVDEIIFPHYSEKHEISLLAFERKHNVSVLRLTNNQALFINSDKKEIIG